ncbi:MAG: heme ABC exporter ATP-binding protein CcmA [Acidimicrobiia bacterium]|nr:heme ABC exporter ATP-binding protein CcmA [Acidimicrobiia bacterium]
MPVVHLDHVVALLGQFPALAGIDLDVQAGEVVLLQGPNGAGKTTLLRLCAGLVAPTDGTAEVLGHDLHTDRASVRRRVGLVGHAGGLYGDLTVRENLTFWARTVGAGADEATAALDRLAVAPRLHDVAVDRLSTGQRKRTALAAVVVRRPEVWLLDEPHAGLDQRGRDIVDELVSDAAAAGATVLVASHELERVGRLDPRVVTVAGGTIREPGRAA